MDDFAKKQLMKYGWTEGKGLGRNENGITEAIRPKLKFDTTGIGHKHIDNNTWWETTFNQAAKNIKIESNSDEIAIKVVDKDTTESLPNLITKKIAQTNRMNQYESFVKTSALYNGKLVECKEPLSVPVKNENTNKYPLAQLTDEELFKACGGRTAHKGARHGLKLNGKLERIAKQEEELLNAYTNKTSDGNSNKYESTGTKYFYPRELMELMEKENALMAARAKAREEIKDLPYDTVENPWPYHFDEYETLKKHKKKHNRKINSLTDKLNEFCRIDETVKKTGTETVEGNAILSKEKKKNKKKCNNSTEIIQNDEDKGIEEDDSLDVDSCKVCRHKKKSVRKKKRQEKFDVDDLAHNNEKKRKRKHHNEESQDLLFVDEGIGNCYTPKKAKKVLKVKGRDDDEDVGKAGYHAKRIIALEQHAVDNIEPLIQHSHSIKEKLTSQSSLTSADDMNRKIEKRKKNKLKRRERKNFQSLSKHLEGIHLDPQRHEIKVNTKIKLDTVVEKLMAVNLTEDKTSEIKSKKKAINK